MDCQNELSTWPEILDSPIKNNIFSIPVRAVNSQEQAPIPTPESKKQHFKITKVTAVRPIVFNPPSFQHPSHSSKSNADKPEVDSKISKSLKSTFKTIIGRKSTQQRSSAFRFVSVMDPVRRLPRSSELLRIDRETAASKEGLYSSTDSLNEGGQKKSRLKIPKPAKLLSLKSKSDEKKKKEDTNNNSRNSADSLERPSSRSRKSMGRRQSKDTILSGVEKIISSAAFTKQDGRDHGSGSPLGSPTKDKTGTPRLSSRLKQVSFDDGSRDKPRSGSGLSSPSYDTVAPKMRPRRNTDRIMRDYRLSTIDVQALKCLMEKVNLYDDKVRDTVLPLLKESSVSSDSAVDTDTLSDKVVTDAEKENLKEKLFLSRKELDSYISFCKKMEREKRQTLSEKEDLVTKTQWLDKRMNLIESENKALKIERADLLNQVYRLRCPTNVPMAERGRLNTKQSKESEDSHADVEISKQRLLYEADAFSQERSKMIKERQRLDEEMRKVQIRCVSLLAQLQHSEKTVDDLQRENEDLRGRLDTSAASLIQEQEILQEKIKNVEQIIENSHEETEPNLCRRMSKLLTNVKNSETDKIKLNQETSHLKRKVDETIRDNRLLTEEKLNLEYELMALRDGMKSDQKVKNECEVRLSEADTKIHHLQAELSHATEKVSSYEQEREGLIERIDEMNGKIGELQRNEVEIESDRVAFQKFIEMLSLEMEEKLGEERVSTDTEATSLQDMADQLGKQISAHLTPNRKIQENYQDLKEELDDIKQENKALKYAMSCRMEIQNMRATQQTCDCSSEKELMKRELEEASSIIDHLEDEVKRLHDDKQSLLLSFLNLQAASRSREPSRTGTDGSGSEVEDSGEESDAEDESEDDDVMCEDSDVSDEEEDEVSDVEELQPSRLSSDSSSHRALRKTISLPVEALRLKSTDTFKASTPDEVIANLEGKVEEMKKTKEVMEEERLGLLDTLCKQDKQLNEFKYEIERLEDALDEAQETETSISQGECCGNCSKSGNEIRQYLGIMESLTEDKLRLEKALSDVKRDKEQLQVDMEATTKEKFLVQSELENLKIELEEAGKKSQKEMDYLLQNMEYMEQENKTLEEHLQKVRQNKLDLLDDLKVGEKDRFGSAKSLQSRGVGQCIADRRRKSQDQEDSVFPSKVSDHEAKPIIVEDYIEGRDDVYNYAQTAPKHTYRRSTGKEDMGSIDENAQPAINDLLSEISELRHIIDCCKRDNRDLRKAVDSTEALLDLEQASVRELERQKFIARNDVLSLKEEVRYLKEVKFGVARGENRGSDDANSQSQPKRPLSLMGLPVGDLKKDGQPQRRKASGPPSSPSVTQAKTLCFKI